MKKGRTERRETAREKEEEEHTMSQIQVEGPSVTGHATIDVGLQAVVVEAQHGGIIKLRFTNAAAQVQRKVIVRPWPQHSLEGYAFFSFLFLVRSCGLKSPFQHPTTTITTTGATFTLDSGETVQLKETGLLTHFSFEQGDLVLSFSEEALSTFAKGGLLTLVDYWR